MWTIRQEQTEAFRQHHLQKFEDEMVEHLTKFSPQRFEIAGEPVVRQVIRLGIANAAKYGLTNRGPVRLYIELMFMFGSYFDTDPQYAWARSALSIDGTQDQTGIVGRLFKSMENYLTQAFGDAADPVEVLQVFTQIRNEHWMMVGESREQCGIRLARALYPQKCKSMVEEDLQTLARNAARIAPEYGFDSVQDFVVLIALMFILGQLFVKDPLYPWTRRHAGTESRWPAGLKSEALTYVINVQSDMKKNLEL